MLKMYTFLFMVATLATLSTCMVSHVPGAIEKCSLENSITHEELDNFLQEFSKETDETERRFQCYIKCLYNELKLTDDNGRLDATKFGNQNSLEPQNEHYVEIANTCNAKYSSVEDQCENMYKVVGCIGLQLEKEEVLELIRNNFTDVEKN